MDKNKVRIRMVLFVLAWFFAQNLNGWAQEVPEMPAKVYDKVSAVTVKIICNNGEKIGSGSIVGITQEGRALVLTACHVVTTNFEETDPDIPLQHYEKIEVKIERELQLVEASVLPQFIDRANDLALIATNRSVLVDNVISYTRSDKVKREQNVRALGFPQTDELTQTVGRIIRLEPKYLVFDANIRQGSSGGPLIDEKGRVIGLSTSIVQVEETKEGFAIPVNLVASVVNGWLSQTKVKKKWQFEKGNGAKVWPWIVGAGVAGGAAILLLKPPNGPEKGTLIIEVDDPTRN